MLVKNFEPHGVTADIEIHIVIVKNNRYKLHDKLNLNVVPCNEVLMESDGSYDEEAFDEVRKEPGDNFYYYKLCTHK